MKTIVRIFIFLIISSSAYSHCGGCPVSNHEKQDHHHSKHTKDKQDKEMCCVSKKHNITLELSDEVTAKFNKITDEYKVAKETLSKQYKEDVKKILSSEEYDSFIDQYKHKK